MTATPLSIRAVRLHGINQSAMAELIGCTPNTYSCWGGLRPPGVISVALLTILADPDAGPAALDVLRRVPARDRR